jgi:hypothetical protein
MKSPSRRLGDCAATAAVVGMLAFGGSHCLRNYQEHKGVETRLRNAPSAVFYYDRNDPMLHIARDELSNTDIPCYVADVLGVDTAKDMYLREVVRRTRQVRPGYRLGQRGDVVAPDLNNDGFIGRGFSVASFR